MKKKKSIPSNTPLMRQYNRIKAEYPDTLLLCRVGDFYETFGEDAIKLSEILDIVLTQRSNGAAGAVKLAGFPHHALDTYMPKLVKVGLRVAVCEQLEDPKQVKGLVKRGVTELITPGLSYYESLLDKKQHNYLASIQIATERWGIAFLDISTGDFWVTEGSPTHIEQLLHSLQPAEVLFNKKEKKSLQPLLTHYATRMLEDWVYYFDYAEEKLKKQFGTTSLRGFGIHHLHQGIIAAGAILRYLEESAQKNIQHILSIRRLEEHDYMSLDRFTVRNLELLQPQQEEGTALIDIIDHTTTPMGARQLRNWLIFPLKQLEKIQQRQAKVAALIKSPTLIEKLVHHLKAIGDLTRLVARLSANRMPPRGFMALRQALEQLQPIQRLLATAPALAELGERLQFCKQLQEQMAVVLCQQLPIVHHPGKLIRTGYNAELDQLREMTNDSQKALEALQEKERKATAISSLKIGYNKVFGYYLEVRNTHKEKVPANWIRKQTLVGAERYITEDLKEYEEKILTAREKAVLLEQNLYERFVKIAQSYVEPLQQNAKIIAELDCYTAFAQLATRKKYHLPELVEEQLLSLEKSIHPIIADTLPVGDYCVPNTITLDTERQQLLLITGPNMAGKSALLRQVAVNVLLAQMGAPIAAKKGTIGVVDKIFSRVGASDNLASHESTFMVEMNEMATILHNFTSRSLVIVDELGRGTGTADGLALAQSCLEYLHSHGKYRPRVLFATHYHELNALEKSLPRLKNFRIGVKKVEGKIVFTHKLLPGGSSESFGIEVAKIAGMPTALIGRADQLIHHLKKGLKKEIVTPLFMPKATGKKTKEAAEKWEKMNLFLKKVDIERLTPIEALLLLQELLNQFKLL